MTGPWSDLYAAVINLDDSSDRWERIAGRLRATGLPAVRMSAVDGRARPADSFTGYDDTSARRLMGRSLLGAELGCFASHVGFLKAFLASGRRFGLVLEDDADISGASVTRLQKALAVLADATTWDVVNCCAAPSRFFSPLAAEQGVGLVRAFHYPMRTTALLWARDGAQKFLDRQPRIVQPIDLELRDFVGASGRGLAFRPALFPPLEGESTIGAAKDLRRIKTRTPAYRLRVLSRRLRENLGALAGWSLEKVAIGK